MRRHSQHACHECDLLLELPEKINQGSLLCPRCGFIITKTSPNSALITLLANEISATLSD